MASKLSQIGLGDIDNSHVNKWLRHYRAGCAGKHGFADPQTASMVARKKQAKGAKVTFYNCKFCGKYHIGEALSGVWK